MTSPGHHRNSPLAPSSLCRGDLDWIVMKCLEKDRDRRYETANGLATDIKRHLNNEPVVARPPSAVYRFRNGSPEQTPVCGRHDHRDGPRGSLAVELAGGPSGTGATRLQGTGRDCAKREKTSSLSNY